MGNFNRFLENLSEKTIAFCGLGMSNLPLISFFAKHCKKIFACDQREEQEIDTSALNKIKAENVEFVLGKNYLNNLCADIIFRTPGMPFFLPELNAARKNGAVLTSEMEIFFDFCPCEIIAVTGSDGKTTTTTIIAEMLKAAGKKVHLGGNIGVPLLPSIHSIKPDDIVVAELSSFQLISMRKSPHIAVITNISPNHLDVHKDMDEYIAAKKNIVLHQNAFGLAVLNRDDPVSESFARDVRGSTSFFSATQRCENGAFMLNDYIYFSKNEKIYSVMPKENISLPGKHNLENYLAAITAVWGKVPVKVMANVAKEFAGVEHRIEFVAEINSVKYYNDSIATTPTRTIRGALSLFEQTSFEQTSFEQKIVLIAGGYDKNIPFNELGEAIVKSVKALILLGQTSEKIEQAVKHSAMYAISYPKIIRVRNMEEAVTAAKNAAMPGDIVALSPGCASFDLYPNFAARGAHFKQVVNNLRFESPLSESYTVCFR